MFVVVGPYRRIHSLPTNLSNRPRQRHKSQKPKFKGQYAPDVVVAAVLLPVRADDVLHRHQRLAPVGGMVGVWD